MSPVHGNEVIEFVKKIRPESEIIIVTAYASVDSTIEAIRHQVFDYIEKPFNIRRLDSIVKNAIEKNRLTKENINLCNELKLQNELLENRMRDAVKELEELAIKDELTGLYNYRFFSSIIVAEISRAIRYKRKLSLVMADLDFFKIYNDTYGHQTGNKALKKVAEILNSNARSADIIVRYGGEEFAILLTETSKGNAKFNMERVLQAMIDAGLKFDSPTGLGTMTLSAGIAECPTDADNSEQLIKAADLALYTAKNTGRNQVHLFNSKKHKLK
jgi:diguanylate cyclase (GGDEF)-like protein